MSRTVRILGTHGVPADYGGFETAADHLSRILVERGWRVVVYCQDEGRGPLTADEWCGVERVHVPVPYDGWRGTGWFDWLSVRHASRYDDIQLTFGYNTATFGLIPRARRIPNIVNMDGLEWQRQKWGPTHKAILFAHERLAATTATHLIADHPVIADRLNQIAPRAKVSTIAYGAPVVQDAPVEPVTALGLVPKEYLTVICRAIPENSLLTIVRAFSARTRGVKLVVLGTYRPDTDPYHRSVLDAAGPEVVFPGAIYDPAVVSALRHHSLAYVHGHTVGGTNPSLVEAMGAGNAVIAHDNPYNRWVAGDGGRYFSSESDLIDLFDMVTTDPDQLDQMSAASSSRHESEFRWERIADQYERILQELDAHAARDAKAMGEEIQ